MDNLRRVSGEEALSILNDPKVIEVRNMCPSGGTYSIARRSDDIAFCDSKIRLEDVTLFLAGPKKIALQVIRVAKSHDTVARYYLLGPEVLERIIADMMYAGIIPRAYNKYIENQVVEVSPNAFDTLRKQARRFNLNFPDKLKSSIYVSEVANINPFNSSPRWYGTVSFKNIVFIVSQGRRKEVILRFEEEETPVLARVRWSQWQSLVYFMLSNEYLGAEWEKLESRRISRVIKRRDRIKAPSYDDMLSELPEFTRRNRRYWIKSRYGLNRQYRFK